MITAAPATGVIAAGGAAAPDEVGILVASRGRLAVAAASLHVGGHLGPEPKVVSKPVVAGRESSTLMPRWRWPVLMVMVACWPWRGGRCESIPMSKDASGLNRTAILHTGALGGPDGAPTTTPAQPRASRLRRPVLIEHPCPTCSAVLCARPIRCSIARCSLPSFWVHTNLAAIRRAQLRLCTRRG
jgi:hypothetical protein